MANIELGATLRELRNKKKYSQQEVADKLGLKNKSTLGSWEIGKSEPDAYTFLRLCSIYGVQDIYSTFGEVCPKEYIDENIIEYSNDDDIPIIIAASSGGSVDANKREDLYTELKQKIVDEVYAARLDIRQLNELLQIVKVLDNTN